MEAPQIIIVVWYAIGILHHISKDGYQAFAYKHNGKANAIMLAIQLAVLYWGGFFQK